ncbi:Uncharacterized protein family UPF0150 [Crinalium epipsammum PCC 9333]|uniref:Uncharacterized protein family UPF0150 n=1 Tax=Crinalium epipsammum PCC 9333 TaxID=1173022 RepID=K9W4B6_9CYAN|nr:hypothetical protein [Crinalium epipsammum]AFZ14300.1 Uncharacterized protein family UPF0150 [Crinalium epipsammum PCC 9333]
MNTEVATSTTNNTSKLNYTVLIEQTESGNYAATILGWSECKAEGATKEEALTKLNQVVNARLQKAEIVSLEIYNPKTEHPWMKFAGMFKDDPQFDEMLEYIEQYRRELDAEAEAYYIQ